MYLCVKGVSPLSKEADLSLGSMLGKTLCRLDEASFENKNCGIYQKKDWFWNEILPSCLLANDGPEVNRRFDNLLQRVAECRRTANQLSHLFPLVRRKFHGVLSNCSSNAGSIPSDEDYKLLRTCLEFSTAAYVFESSADPELLGMDAFLMNDLLRWIIIHTSRLGIDGSHTSANERAKYDFSLLKVCLLSEESARRQKVLLETILREIVAAKCDFGVLALGLQELCRSPLDEGENSLLDAIKCEAFDNLVVLAVKESFKDSMSTKSDTLEVFLRTCSGLCETVKVPLVGTTVWSKWVEIAWSRQDDRVVHSILPVLLDLVSNGSLSTLEENLNAVLMAWHVGDHLWVKAAALLLTPGFEELRAVFVESAEIKLRLSLAPLCDVSSELLRDDIVEECRHWSERAARWFNHNDRIPGHEKFDCVGLADLETWRTAARSDKSISDVLIRCTFGLLCGMSNDAERFAVLFGEDGRSDRIPLFAIMMIVASDPVARDCTSKEYRCSALASIIGGRVMFSDSLVYCCVGALVRFMEDSMAESDSCAWARRSAIAISEFIGAMISPYMPRQGKGHNDHIDASSLKKGDTVWYVVNTAQDNVREKAEVVNVHAEDFPRLFFSIRIETAGVTRERQTVAERLRSKEVSTQPSISETDIPPEEFLLRTKVGRLLVDKVVKPTLASDHVQRRHEVEIGAECFHIVVTQCGVLGKAGIGSLRYDLFQTLTSLQTRAVQHIETNRLELAALALRGLGLSLGVRGLPVHSNFLLEYFQFDPEPSLVSLVALCDSDDVQEVMYHPTLMWTSVAAGSIGQPELRKDVMRMICLVASRIACKDNYDAYYAVRALSNVFRSPTEQSCEFEDKAISNLIVLFAMAGKIEDRFLGIDVTPWWSEPLESLIDEMIRNRKSILRDAAREKMSHLLGTLSCSFKRWLSFRLLHLASKTCAPLHRDATGDLLPIMTQRRLLHWKKDLISDEADDLENDFLTVFEWVPSDLMVEMESWIEDETYFDDAHEDTTIARMLGWLVFLQYLESSAAADARNRVAFSSYASRTGCVFFVLSSCVMHLDVDFDRKSTEKNVSTIDDIIVNKQSVNVTELSRTVLFHTVEVFPTLSRSWWEEDCPKALSATVSKFVQLMVAPETFRRELERINGAMMKSVTGEMTVKGSTVSREVTATYQQDECTLSIAIQIPHNFPFRSVDVDGRKTLGVSESRFKRWALQMRQILNNQDGTLLDALMLWKRYVEKEFEGVEPCPVCYSVLAVKTHELPNLQCKTCANTFHSSCLQKWFTSSGKSHCVVCQQPWSGTRIS